MIKVLKLRGILLLSLGFESHWLHFFGVMLPNIKTSNLSCYCVRNFCRLGHKNPGINQVRVCVSLCFSLSVPLLCFSSPGFSSVFLLSFRVCISLLCFLCVCFYFIFRLSVHPRILLVYSWSSGLPLFASPPPFLRVLSVFPRSLCSCVPLSSFFSCSPLY